MTDTTSPVTGVARRTMLSKVPEVTVWFWIIKILCTTVGESFADFINTGLGVGLNMTAVTFTVVLAVVLGVQLGLNRYVPVVYWLAVVVLSVTGTLYTDILTDSLGVPLAISSGFFAVLLAVVFGVWFARERTLSIHSIITTPRELFYWLAVLVTFALGTAAGDWTLSLTGWGPGVSVLLPAGLILAIVIGWRLGANAVLSFWLAYILTRPLGANLGDWLASPSAAHGLGLGYGPTSVIFLAAILAAVIYLTTSRADVIDTPEQVDTRHVTRRPARERLMLGYYAVIVVATVALLVWAAGQPRAPQTTASNEEEGGSTPTGATHAPARASAVFPPADVAGFRIITQTTLQDVRGGDQAAAKARIKDLETAWDEDQARLQPMDQASWTALDRQIDTVLTALRSPRPDPATEIPALNSLLTSLQ